MKESKNDSDDLWGDDAPAPVVKDGGTVYRAGGKMTDTPRKKKPGEISAKTARARELFLHGNGDGKPIRSVAILAEKSGVHPSTVEKWLPVWKRESDALARGSTGKLTLVADINGEIVAWHRAGVDTLKAEIDRLKVLIPKLTPGSDLHVTTTKQYALLFKRWEESSGFAAHVETATVAHRELIKAAARLKAKGEADRTERQASAIEFN